MVERALQPAGAISDRIDAEATPFAQKELYYFTDRWSHAP